MLEFLAGLVVGGCLGVFVAALGVAAARGERDDGDVVERLDITQNRMAHASELIHQVSEIRPRWVEHPVEIIYTDYSKAKGQSLLNSVNILAELFFR